MNSAEWGARRWKSLQRKKIESLVSEIIMILLNTESQNIAAKEYWKINWNFKWNWSTTIQTP